MSRPAGTATQPEPCIHLVFSSCSSTSASESDVRSPSREDSEDLAGSPANFLFKRHARRRSTASAETTRKRIVEIASSDGEGDSDAARTGTGATASVSTSPPLRPARKDTPDTTSEGSSSGQADNLDATESTGSIAEDVDDDIEFEGAGPQANQLLRRMYGVGRRWSEDEDGAAIVELDEGGEEAVRADLEGHLDAGGAGDAAAHPASRQIRRTLSEETLKSKDAFDMSAIGKAAAAAQAYRTAASHEKARLAEEQGDEADDEEDGRQKARR